MKNYKRHKSKTFDEKDTINGKVMFYFRKTGKKKSTDKNSSNIVIECEGKKLIFSLCSDKIENFSNPSWNFHKLKQTLLFLYSQKDLNDSNLTNSNKDSFIQLVNTVDDDNFEKNKPILYNCPNHKTCILNSNFALSSEKERNKTYNQRIIKYKDINKISKIKINESKNEKKNKEDYINKKNNFNIYNQHICNICDLLKPSNKFIFLPICNHTFCINCAKSFYEDLIEKGEFNLKCPYYKCSKVLSSISFLKNIISQKHYERLIGNNKQKNNQKEQNNLNNKALRLGGKQTISSYTKGTKKSSTINTVDKNISKLEINSIIEKYSKKNVLSVTKNDDEYIIYSMFRECFCPCCNLPCLFGKTLSNHLKCLNCFKSICKFCFKLVDTDHFNTYSQKCCKNYRFFLWKNKHSSTFTQKRYNGYFENLCLFFVSYILFVVFLYFLLFKIVDYLIPYEEIKKKPITYQDNKTITKFLTISMTVLKRKKQLKINNCKRLFKKILNILVKILLIWLPLVILIFTFPYYPLYFIIFEYFL
jgi:hypothetical protein